MLYSISKLPPLLNSLLSEFPEIKIKFTNKSRVS